MRILKIRLASYLCYETHLQNQNFSCQIEADADRIIIESVINLQSENIAVASEDVDVSFLLTWISPINREIYFQLPAKAKISQRVYSILI